MSTNTDTDTEPTDTDTETNTVECASCGCDCDADETITTTDGGIGPCCLSDYITCDRCDDVVWTAGVRDVHGVSRRAVAVWCDSCVRTHTYFCDACDRYFSDDRCATEVITSTRGRTHTWCESCTETNTVKCHGCGAHVSDDVAVERDDDRYCPGCDPGESGLGSYGSTAERWRGRWQYRGTDLGLAWCEGAPSLRFGLELEWCAGSSDIKTVVGRLRSALGDFVAGVDRDGSVDGGGELITHPATVDEHRKIWANFKPPPGAIAHDTDCCGFHIHATRRAVAPTTWAKLSHFLADPSSQHAFFRLFRRAYSETYARAVAVEKKSNEAQGKVGQGRYCVLNRTPSATVELRWPRGTLNKETIVATVEWYRAALAWLTQRSLAAEHTWADFIRAITTDPALRADTRILRSYLVRRGLLPPPKTAPKADPAEPVDTTDPEPYTAPIPDPPVAR